MITKVSVLLLPILAACLLLPRPGLAQFGPGDGGGFMPPPGGFGPNYAAIPNITCDQLNCAKGTCKINSTSSRDANGYNYSYSYKCQCDNGWSVPSGAFLVPFAPCALPNCTAETNCPAAEQPPPQSINPINVDFSKPCSWAFCGGGECEPKSAISYACKCKSGFKNLFNNTLFPCYADCSIGTECKKQRVGFLNATAATTGGGQGSTGGDGSTPAVANTAIPDNFPCFLTMVLSLAALIA